MPNIIEITDLQSRELDIYARLSEPQLLHYYEPDGGLFIAESPTVIGLALDKGYKPVSMLMERRHINGEAKQLIERCRDIPVFTADDELLTKLTGFHLTRGALCAIKRAPLPSVEQVCKNARRIAVLEDVVNPTNVGAIMRSAAALGMDALLLTPSCSDPLYRRAARVSMGTVFQIPWTYFDDDSKPIEQLHALGFTTAAMALCDNTLCIDDPQLRAAERLAIILGTEGSGLKPQTIAKCSCTVKIPMSHGVDSLNVAAASAVAFWQLGQKTTI